MYHYSRYIARQLTHSTLLTAFSLTSIVWLTQALRLMDFIVNQGVGLDMFFLLTLLLMPSLLLTILPLALFCAAAYVYQKLKTDSELVVLQAAGVSRLRLARPALAVAAGVALAGYLVAFWVMPMCYAKFRDTQSYLRNNYVSVLLQEGVFNSPVDGLTVYARERDSDGTYLGILVHDNRKGDISMTMMAERGTLVSSPQGQRFHLTNGNRQEMRAGRLSLLNFDSYVLDLSMYGKDAGPRSVDVRELYLPGLLARQGLTADEIARRRGELHQRIIWPAYAFTLTLVGLAVLLSGEFSRRGNAKRVLAASLSVGLLAVLGIALRNVSGASLFYLLLGYLNLIVPAVAAYALLRGRDTENKRAI